MVRKASLAAAVLFFVAAVPLARSQGVVEERAEARSALADELRTYAEWCRGRQYFLERRRVLLTVLELAPDDEVSMRALGWVRDASGQLAPPEKEREPRNFNFGPRGQEEAHERFASAVAPYMERMNALRADPSLTGSERAAIVEEMLLLVPDDPVLRAERGEVLRDGAWVMEETEAGVKRRAELDEVVRTARVDTKLEPCEPFERERTFAFPWTAGYRTAEARVLGTVPAAELERVARSMHEARALFGAVFERDGGLPEDLAVFVFRSPEEGRSFLAQHAVLTPEEIERGATFSGLWLPGLHEIVYWAEAEELRIDGVVRLLFEAMLGNAFHTAANLPWVHEGFGFLLAERVTGTRLSWFAKAEAAAAGQALRARLLSTDDWMAEARRLFGAGDGPRFADLEERTLETISSAELLYAYALAAYLIEGRAGSAGKLLQRIGFGRRPSAALEEVLGLDPQRLDERVRRWLIERSPLPRTAERDPSPKPSATDSPLKRR